MSNEAFNKLLDLAEKAEASLIIIELSEYDKELIRITEWFRESEHANLQTFRRAIVGVCERHSKTETEVLHDLFAC